jgi:formylglycine-generating enzyme required for sulfatase activity
MVFSVLFFLSIFIFGEDMCKKHKAAGIAMLILWWSLVLLGCPTDSSPDSSPEVTGVKVSPASAAVEKGATKQFSAVVEGSNNPSQTVTWSVSGGSSGTSINTSGLLTVVENETAASLTVRATSTADATKSGTAAVTVTASTPAQGMVSISGGTFMMGQTGVAEPVHSVTVSGFSMGRYEVTQAEYRAVMGTNPSYFSGDNLPVEKVSWYDAIAYCNALSQREGLTPAYTIDKSRSDPNNTSDYDDLKWTVTWNRNAIGYRLPSEAEWEYACRAGTTTPYYTGNAITDDTGWYITNSGNKTHEVGQKPANPWGLYDMAGNVAEWCWDWYGSYFSSSQTNPEGSTTGSLRVNRGGSWYFIAQFLRSAHRDYVSPSDRYRAVGFRLARP